MILWALKTLSIFLSVWPAPSHQPPKLPKLGGPQARVTTKSRLLRCNCKVFLPAPAGAGSQPAENRFCLTWVVKNTYALNHSMVCFMTKKICDSDHTSRAPAPLGTPHGGAAACLAFYLAFWSPDGVQNSPRQPTAAHATITTKSRILPFRPPPQAPSTPRDLP